MDPFLKFPAPLLLSIIKLLPDLGTLFCLDRASPTVASLVDECGAEIMEAIMPETLSQETRNVIQIIAMIRSNSLFSDLLYQFIEMYINHDKPCKSRDIEGCSKRHYPPVDLRSSEARKLCSKKPLSLKFAASISSTVLREILELAVQIRCSRGFSLQ